MVQAKGITRICDATREQLSIDFVHRFSQSFFSSWISIFWLIEFNHKCMHSHLGPNMLPKYKHKSRGRYTFMKSMILWNFCTVPFIDSCTVLTSQIWVAPERAAYKKSIKSLKYHNVALDWVNQICPNFCWLVSKIIFHSPNLHKCLGKLKSPLKFPSRVKTLNKIYHLILPAVTGFRYIFVARFIKGHTQL